MHIYKLRWYGDGQIVAEKTTTDLTTARQLYGTQSFANCATPRLIIDGESIPYHIADRIMMLGQWRPKVAINRKKEIEGHE